MLGIAILVVFSLGVTAFALYDPKRFAAPKLPPELGNWRVVAEDARHRTEERHLVLERGPFRRKCLLRQVRVRDVESGQIRSVAPEEVLRRWI